MKADPVRTRPAWPVWQARQPTQRLEHDMTDEQTKGAISKARGRVEAAVGKLTGNRRGQLQGQVRQVKGSAQEALGDLQAAPEPRGKGAQR